MSVTALRVLWVVGVLWGSAAESTTFITDRTTVWVGGTTMIPFAVEATVKEDLTLPATVKGERLELIGSATVVEGYRLGFVRVRGVMPGRATLTVGDASIAVDIKRHSARDKQLSYPSRIVAPAMGAAVWGKIAVGVEVFDDPIRLGRSRFSEAEEDRHRVALRVPQGAVVEKLGSTTLKDGPVRLVSFAVDLSKVQPGPITLMAEIPCSGDDTSKPGVVSSEPVALNVVEAPTDRLIANEAEAHQEAERPRRYREKPPKLTDSKTASGGKYVNNNGQRPQLVIPLQLEHNGWYQLMLTASGDPGGGAWPTVGVRTHNPSGENESNEQYLAAGQVISDDWQRHAIGQPVWLKAGDMVLVPQFDNDFNAGKKSGDRNLRIDRYELLRLEDRPPTTTTGESITSDLIVAFADSLHGRTLAGDTSIVGVTHRRDRKKTPPPLVTLLVDGESFTPQYSARPVFTLPRSAVKREGSTLRLRAVAADGTVAYSPAVTVAMAEFPDDSAESVPLAQSEHRFTLADPRWDQQIRKALSEDKRAYGERVRLFASRGHADLDLPQDMTGPFNIEIDARGDQFDGPPIARVTLHVGDQTIEVGQVEVNTRYYKMFDAGHVDLPIGEKHVRVSFINDKYDAKSKKDRNLSLRAVRLVASRDKDRTPPVARIVYPAPEAEVYGVDAVVVETADDRALAWVELLIDGERTGIREPVRDGLSRRWLPMPLRNVASGGREVSVRVADRAGNVAVSEPVPILVTSQPPAVPGKYERAVRLLDRFAFGPEPRALADVLVMGERDYLSDALSPIDPGVAIAWRAALVRQPADNNGGQVVRRAIDHALVTPNPVRARLTLFLDNHFTTWQRKTRAERKAIDHATFVELGPAPFADLLHASATSPAMLVYLDQHRSYGKRLNENYAREIMELHTLGVDGGYTQQDVTELANILTGWSMTDHARLDGGGGYRASSFRYIPGLNDPVSRVVFGLRLPEAEDRARRYDRVEMVLDMLAAHPGTARHIATKLAEHYVTVPAPPELVDALTGVYLESGGDLAAMLLAIVEADALSSREFRPRLLHPIDYALRLSRTAGDRNPGVIAGFLNQSGFGLFDRDTPDGYPEEDQAYADTNAMLQRWRFARQFEGPLSSQLPWTMRQPPKEADAAVLGAWHQRVIDYYAIRLTGRPLGKSSNAAALAALDEAQLRPDDSIRMIATLIAQLPEANLH